ncbi:MAG: NifU family protein [Aquihabitans sp.]
MDDATTTDPQVSPFAASPTDTETPVSTGRAVPLRVTDNALSQVMGILAAEDEPESLGLRVEVTGINGAEYAYDLSFDERAVAADDDLIYQQGDLVVIIPANSVDSLWGATLDLPSAPGQGGLVIRNPNRPESDINYDVELSGTVAERVNQLLEQMINPSLASHGGFATLVELIDDDTKAVVLMGGGCQGCAVSAITLREGIRKSIVQYIPEITEVVDGTDHDAGENPYYS